MSEEEQFSFKKLFIPFTNGKALHFIIIIGFLIFGNGLFNNFVGDDNTQIVDNPAIHSLTNFPSFFFTNRLDNAGSVKLGATYFKPLLDSSYALTYAVFGLNFFGYHLIQLLFYITNACLVYFFFQHYFRKSLAFLLAFLFLIHPINSENALYLADTQEVLFFFFGMTGLLLLRKYQTQKGLLMASVCFLLSLLSKETGVLFLLIAVVSLFLQNKRRLLAFSGYGVGVFLLYALLRIHAVGLTAQALINAPIGRLSLQERMINIPAIIFFYFQTFFFPLNLSSSWQWVYTTLDWKSFFLPLLVDSFFFLALAAVGVLIFKKQRKKYFAAFLFFSLWLILGISFHLQILPLDQTVAERWFYFPIIGMLGIVGLLCELFNLKLRPMWIVTIIVIIFSLLSLRSFSRTFDYRNDFILAKHDVQVAPDSYNFEYIISHAYYQAGLLKEAKMHAQRSIQLFPYITNYTNLGAIESRLGHYKEARTAYLNALKYGTDTLPYENLASLSFVYGDPKENVAFIKNVAQKKYPADEKLWFDLIVDEYSHGMTTEAKADMQIAKQYSHSSGLEYIESLMNNNKPLSLKIVNGNVMFVTQ